MTSLSLSVLFCCKREYGNRTLARCAVNIQERIQMLANRQLNRFSTIDKTLLCAFSRAHTQVLWCKCHHRSLFSWRGNQIREASWPTRKRQRCNSPLSFDSRATSATTRLSPGRVLKWWKLRHQGRHLHGLSSTFVVIHMDQLTYCCRRASQ